MTATLQFVVRSGARSSPGNRRQENQDAFLDRPPVFLVADGMGGHAAGREAADLVVQAFAGTTWPQWVTPADLDRALAVAESGVRALGEKVAGAPGSTLSGVALASQDGVPSWLVFNIGDSRTYLLRDGRLEQVTVDHSHVQSLLDQGITPDANQAHAGKHVITRAVGGGLRPRPRLDLWLLPARAGDRVLVCSDGLTGELSDSLITASLLTHADADEAAARLVDAALDGLARDNVTVVVIDAVHVAGSAPPPVPDDTVDTVDTLPAAVMHRSEDTVPQGWAGVVE